MLMAAPMRSARFGSVLWPGGDVDGSVSAKFKLLVSYGGRLACCASRALIERSGGVVHVS